MGCMSPCILGDFRIMGRTSWMSCELSFVWLYPCVTGTLRYRAPWRNGQPTMESEDIFTFLRFFFYGDSTVIPLVVPDELHLRVNIVRSPPSLLSLPISRHLLHRQGLPQPMMDGLAPQLPSNRRK